MVEDPKPEKVAQLQLHRGRSRKNFFEYQLESARGSLEEIKKYSVFEGEEILDVGCGFGGNSVYFALGGFKVTAVDNQSYDNEALKNAIASAKNKDATVKFCFADAHHLPFKPNSFRVVRLDSVLEHFERPELGIMECRRVLKTGGYLFVNFPLYYSAFGGHTFDYIKVPWLHLLPASWVCKILRCLRSKPGFITTGYVERLYMSLNKMTLTRYNRMVSECGFDEVFFKQTLFLPHDAALFFNEIKRSIAYRSIKMFKKAFNYFSFTSIIVFGFLYCIYRIPFRSYKPFNDLISSGIRSVLKK